MITEDYVSFETARLLKEMKFNVPVHDHYTKVGTRWHCEDKEDFNAEKKVECFSCPTLQMAMKWLRKVYWLNIFPQFDRWGKNWSVIIKSMDDRNIIHNNTALEMSGFDSYESSVDAAIQYCLEKLIRL